MNYYVYPLPRLLLPEERLLPEDLEELPDDLTLPEEDLELLELDLTEPEDLVLLVGVEILVLDLVDRDVDGLVTLVVEPDLEVRTVSLVLREFLIVLDVELELALVLLVFLDNAALDDLREV